jgi:salicylate hydroxylase
MRDLPSIMIAGGGIAGLAAAVALARKRRDIAVYERSAHFETAGAGLQASPNAVRALKAIGAWDAFAPHTYAPPAILIRDGPSGRLLKRIALGEVFIRRFGEPYRVAHRAHLHGALLETAKAVGGIALKTGSEVAGYRNDGRRIVALMEGGAEHAGAVLIGADGIRSRLRAQMLDDGPPASQGHTIYRALLPMPSHGELDSVSLWLSPGAHLVHYPVDGGKLLNVVAAIESGDPATAFRDGGDAIKSVLALVKDWTAWPAADRLPAPRWQDGRALLIGDAAHAALPYLAQGAAMALEDAALLGMLIDSADPEQAFAVFARERMARTARVAKESRAQGALYHQAGAARAARNAALMLMGEGMFLSRLAWLYGEAQR